MTCFPSAHIARESIQCVDHLIVPTLSRLRSRLTDDGRNIQTAQMIFYAIYSENPPLHRIEWMMPEAAYARNRRVLTPCMLPPRANQVCTQALVLATYVRAKQVPAWSLLLLLISKRMHSVYVLRLFNDCVAMLFAYASIYLFTNRCHLPTFPSAP